MSTKTIKQRIALVAATALTAGFISVVSAPASNAAANVAAGTTQTAAATEAVLNIATLASTTGSPVTTTTNTTNASVGLVNVSSVLGDLTAGTTQTAVLLNSGSLVVYSATTTANAASVITVSGGTLSGGISGSTLTAMNGTRTAFAAQGDTGTDVMAVAATPDAGATSMTVSLYTFPATTTAATAVTAPTLGTIAGLISVTITTASVAGAMSTAKSGVWYSSAGGAESLTEDATSGTWLTKSPTSQFANIRVRDAFGNALTSTTGLLQATATNGALVAINASGTTTAGTASTAFRTGATADSNTLVVKAPTFAPLTTAVTVSYNGVVVATKSFTFTGPVSKVTLGAAARIGALDQAATATVKGASISFADSAGNTILPVAGSAF